MFTYDEAKKYLIEHLRRDVEYHSRGEYPKIGEGFDVFDQNLPRTSGPEFNKLFVAFNFWDSWQDARNHDWRYYREIPQSAWTLLALQLIKDIEEEREITSTIILENFETKHIMRESKRKKYLWLAVLGILFGLYCIYAAAFHAWQTAYHTDKAIIRIHSIWFYISIALSAISFVLSGIIIYKFKRKSSKVEQ